MQLAVLTDLPGGATALLPALEFLDHELAVTEIAKVELVQGVDLVLVDAVTDLATASYACRAASAAETAFPILVVVSDGGLAALKVSWGFDDWILARAQPAEVETRLRLAAERHAALRRTAVAHVGELSIDEETYVVRLKGRPLDLTFREFELLKYLANNSGRVFTRGQLLQAVWGYDYFGGTRTVDVHIRRLRAKLGPEQESLIGTVRGVGYKLNPQGPEGP